MNREAIVLVAVILLACVAGSVRCFEDLPEGVERIGASALWDNNSNMQVDPWANAGQNSCIAIIDSGVFYQEINESYIQHHVDLQENMLTDGQGKAGIGFLWNDYSGVVEEVEAYDDWREDSHGTHVTGIAAAVDNEQGVIGVSPKVKVFVLSCRPPWPLDYDKVARECAAAIVWAVINDFQFISVSSGMYGWELAPYTVGLLREACECARFSNRIVFAAAGNEGTSDLPYPAAFVSENDHVVPVGAVCYNGTRCHFSNYGRNVTFAPGYNINSTIRNDGYGPQAGTSMACPHVAAAAALVNSSLHEPAFELHGNNYWEPDEVLNKLRNTTLGLGENPGHDDVYGYGLVNAYRANQRPEGNIQNQNAWVNAGDAVKLGSAFGMDSNMSGWDRSKDINIDSYVNAKDAVILGKHFGEGSEGSATGELLTSFSSKLKVQPSSLTFYADTTGVGDNFTVSIVAENVSDVYGWEFKLSWTPGLLDCVNETLNFGLWTDRLGPWVAVPVDNENGTYHQSLTAKLPAVSFNGTTWLANLTFQITQAPPEGGTVSTALTLSTTSGQNYCLFNSSASDIPHDFVQGAYSFTSPRYMRGDLCTVNGLEAYRLNTTQSTVSRVVNVTENESNTVYWGVQVWKRSGAGTETELTTGVPVAVVSRSISGSGLQSSTWNYPNVTLAQTDSIVVRVYCMNGCPWTLIATFTTPQLNASRLNPSTCTIYYWTQRSYLSGGLGKTIGYYRWGTTTYNSRIHNLTTT